MLPHFECFPSDSGHHRADRNMAEIAPGDVFGSKARRMDVSPSASLLARPSGRKRRTPGFPSPVTPSLLLAPDIVERVEDVATNFHRVVFGAIQPVRPDHVEKLVLVLVFPLAGVADDVAPEAMDPRQDFMSGRSVHRAEVDSLVATIFQAPVGGVPVRNEQAADGGVCRG